MNRLIGWIILDEEGENRNRFIGWIILDDDDEEGTETSRGARTI